MSTWKVTIEGQDYFEHDLSLDDAEWVCQYTGVNSWRAVHPLLNGPKHTKACLAALLRKREPDLSREQALTKVGELSIDVVNSFQAVTEDDRPITYSGGLPDVDPSTAVKPTA